MRPEVDKGLGVAAVLGAATIFSWGFVIVKHLGLDAPLIASWRLVIGGSFLTVLALLLRTPWPRNYGPVLAAGLAFGGHQLLYILATQRTSIAIVTLVGALKPLVVAFVSLRVVGERLPSSFKTWSALALLGVALVVYANYDDASRTLTGDLLAVANLVVVTVFLLMSKRARLEGAPTLTFTACMIWVALLVVAPGLLWTNRATPAEGWQWGLIALLALGPGNGHLLVNWAHRRVSAALAVLLLLMVPLLASIWAHLVFGEPYGIRHALGMLLVLVAIEGGRRAEARVTRESALDTAITAPKG